jgi:hypothetical protein
MLVVLDREQEASLLQMAADLEVEPSVLLVHLVSDRLAAQPLELWRS